MIKYAHEEVLAGTLSTITYCEIQRMSSRELQEILEAIEWDVISATEGLFNEDLDGNDFDIDLKYFMKKYFKRFPTPKYERLVKELAKYSHFK